MSQASIHDPECFPIISEKRQMLMNTWLRKQLYYRMKELLMRKFHVNQKQKDVSTSPLYLSRVFIFSGSLLILSYFNTFHSENEFRETVNNNISNLE